jgi:hypothetical protein
MDNRRDVDESSQLALPPKPSGAELPAARARAILMLIRLEFREKLRRDRWTTFEMKVWLRTGRCPKRVREADNPFVSTTRWFSDERYRRQLSDDAAWVTLRWAKIEKEGLQPWHGLRHTALTNDAAVGNPNAYVQAKPAIRSSRSRSGTSTRRRPRSPVLSSEARSGCSVPTPVPERPPLGLRTEKPRVSGAFL